MIVHCSCFSISSFDTVNHYTWKGTLHVLGKPSEAVSQQFLLVWLTLAKNRSEAEGGCVCDSLSRLFLARNKDSNL